MPKIDFFRAYRVAISAIRALPQTIPVATSIPDIQVWIRRSDPVLSFNYVPHRNGKTVKSGSITIKLLVCFKVEETVVTMDINPLVTNDGSVDINQFRAEYLRIIHSEAFSKELKGSLIGSLRNFHDIFNAYACATRMIIEAVNFDCPFQDTHSAFA